MIMITVCHGTRTRSFSFFLLCYVFKLYFFLGAATCFLSVLVAGAGSLLFTLMSVLDLVSGGLAAPAPDDAAAGADDFLALAPPFLACGKTREWLSQLFLIMVLEQGRRRATNRGQ